MIEIKNEVYEIGSVAKQASGSVLFRSGKSVILATVSVDDENVVEDDFLPLTVQYIEKSYASAKFPSGFIKRESKPSDFETLTSRIIDRTLRPLFPKGYAHQTQITVIVLSYDGSVDLQVCALKAASTALYVSSIPIEHSACACRVTRVDGEFILNPNMSELKSGDFDLYVSGTNEDLLMIEMKSLRGNHSNEILEEELLQAISLAQSEISSTCGQYREKLKAFCSQPIELSLKSDLINSEIYEFIASNYGVKVRDALNKMAKSERFGELKSIAKDIFQKENSKGWSFDEIYSALLVFKREIVRCVILDEQKRMDGRGLKDVRPIDIKTNILPCAHGSALFTRGETQALVVCTIGSENDAQTYENLGDKTSSKERFMFHYNFPSFSVGEAYMVGAPGRRELGHGNLAKRALESNISDSRVVRLVSEILESNGSSSMASVCGGSLALCATQVEIDNLVAGVAMGLVIDGDRYAILTDIMGLEDHDGDMDFKIAGSKNGITAMQMDIKLGGIKSNILEEALIQAKEAREHILNIMEEARGKIVFNNDILPLAESFMIDSGKIVDLIGQGGKTIKGIIDRFGVSIDLNRDTGEVRVSGIGRDRLLETKSYILDLLSGQNSQAQYCVGDEFLGNIKKIVDFGAFVSLPNGGDGLIHVSKITKDRNQSISEVLQEGQEVKCVVLSIEKGRVELALV